MSYTLNNSGAWQELPDGGRHWRLKVNMQGALSTNTYYDRFWLPTGAKFFVYSEETGQTIGAITSEFIEGSKEKPVEFATSLIYGENVVYEYYQPASVRESAVISISRIDYGYRLINNPYQESLRNFGDAPACHININHPDGKIWQQKEKHAIARVSISSPNGSWWCFCALINNTRNNFTPYVLTANHCLSGLDAMGNTNASQWVFYWEYEHPGCKNLSSEPSLVSTVGASVRANNEVTDFALLQLTQDPCNNSLALPYYLGLDRSTSPPQTAVGIHHPKGDVKKISFVNQVVSSGLISWNDNTISLPNTH
ncbi:MAG: S1 family peptidase [Candidatus Azobacteroides sp.]|nr:S1 family peptidase [Candidatus Azobacteroides sp.]